ncbi:MAG TPA: hypothetical protein VFW75_03020 [Acetobacteraceae bacterium]|nr:hypothetical protein [Acetobacteraceae bacterium]
MATRLDDGAIMATALMRPELGRRAPPSQLRVVLAIGNHRV